VTLRELTAIVARGFVGVRETGNNRGAWVQAFQHAAKIAPGDPWCMAFVNACAEIAAASLGLVSPLERMPLQGYVANLVTKFPAVPLAVALPGDLLAVWSAGLNRHAHVALIEAIRTDGTLETIEGNSNDEGSREGYEVCRRTRKVGERDVIVRWTRTVDLAPAAKAAA
jgi:hypothetical protein